MSLTTWVFVIGFVGPILIGMLGGTAYGILEVLAPTWYLHLKERRKARIKGLKEEYQS